MLMPASYLSTGVPTRTVTVFAHSFFLCHQSLGEKKPRVFALAVSVVTAENIAAGSQRVFRSVLLFSTFVWLKTEASEMN